MRPRRNAFSLIELMIVVVVPGILPAISRHSDVTESARHAACR